MGILRDMFRIGEIDPRAKKHAHCVEAVYLIWTVQNEDQYCWFVDELNEFGMEVKDLVNNNCVTLLTFYIRNAKICSLYLCDSY